MLCEITMFEIIYLIYMYFIFETNYSFNSAIFNNEIQNMGYFFIHDTSNYENKICGFGKIMAIVAIILAWLRLNYKGYFYTNIIFDIICISLAFIMNLNAFVYIIPIILCEIYIIFL